jgi:hypothetical protein
MLSVGANTFAKDNLAGTVLFSLGSLAAWTFGHLIGAKQRLRDVEIMFKTLAWLYASLVVSVFILRSTLDITSLGILWSSICVILSLVLTFGVYRYLKDGLPKKGQNNFSPVYCWHSNGFSICYLCGHRLLLVL